MERKAVFVDLSNFFSRLVQSGIGSERDMRDYFLDWLDLDLLATSLAGEGVPCWVFYSGRRLGSKSERVDSTHLNKYIERINQLPGVTAIDVEIPGEQRETAFVECKECRTNQPVQWVSEKGVDASLIVHLFDTKESWDHAYLLSGDADFTPAVRSLRRRGKMITAAGFEGASRALLREVFDFVNLEEYVMHDLAAYHLFRENGIVERWLSDPVNFVGGKHIDNRPVELSVHSFALDNNAWSDVLFRNGQPILPRGYRLLLFKEERVFDLVERDRMLKAFFDSFPALFHDTREVLMSPKSLQGIERRMKPLFDKFSGLWSSDSILLVGGNGRCIVIFCTPA
jgi:hypothetical protein